MRCTVIAVMMFALGFAFHYVITAFGQTESAKIRRHWQAIDDLRDYVADPQNMSSVDGMIVVSNPPDPMPDLAALVAYGELKHVDLILPEAPNSRAAQRYLMQYVGQRDDIVYFAGNSTYAAFRPAGNQPLQLNLWYLPGAEEAIQTLMKKLESMDDDTETPAAEGAIAP
ncbi:MAG: hypothetical protein MI861_15290 [Pirellulales bacterium]|nr:hypothetical protein [Pirellulales bacterium]